LFCFVAGLFPGGPEWDQTIAVCWAKKKQEEHAQWMEQIASANIRKDQEWFIKTVADFQGTHIEFVSCAV